MSEIYDIAIVGAGPAGAFLARSLATKCSDMKILLIDGQGDGNKKPCGGLLAPDAQKVFAQLDMSLPSSVLVDPQIFTVETVDLVTKKVRYYQRHYLNMDRYRFDKWLVSLVPDKVDVISNRVKGIEKREGAFILTVNGASVTARFVVGADGSGSTVRKLSGKKYPKQYVAIQEWYKSYGKDIPYYSCIFDKKTSESCSWTIHKDGYTVFGGAFKPKGCAKAFEAQKSRLEDFMGATLGAPVKREACLVSSPRHFGDIFCGNDGAFLVGEAAGFISASSFEGISSALISAKKLAEAFEKHKNDGKRVLKAYKKKTLSLKFKMLTKMFKRKVLFSQSLRSMIMQSGVQSIKMEK